MRIFLGKVSCFLGWHEFISSIQDYIDEFGYVPLDNRIAKNARCSRCNSKYGVE